MAACVALGAAVASGADSGRGPPATDTLLSPGVQVSSATMARPEVLIYVDDDCRVCVDVLSASKADDADTSRIVVVAAINGADAAVRACRIAWPQDRVYVDVAGDLGTRLQLQGVPVMLGLVWEEIRWLWSGALPPKETCDR